MTVFYVIVTSGIILASIKIFRELYTPVPAELEQKWTFRMVFVLFKVNRSIARILSVFRVFGKTLEENMATFTDWWLPRCVMDDEQVLTTLANFDGIPVRIHRPKSPRETGLIPALVYLHGGGFVYGSSASFHPFTRRLCESLKIVVVSVDYRLAPVHVFPAAFLDCLAAIKWLLLNGPKLNIDPNRIAVAGDSAGGQLTAAVVKRIHDDPTVPNPKLQALFYPGLQMLNLGTSSYEKYDSAFNTHGGMLTRYEATNYLSLYIFGNDPDRLVFREWLISNNIITPEHREQNPCYLQYIADDLVPENLRDDVIKVKKKSEQAEADPRMWEKYSHLLLDPRLSPLLADSLQGLPTTYIATAHYDCFRDDSVFYVQRLREAGVPVKWINYKDGFHGALPIVFDFFWVGRNMEQDFVDFTREFL